MSKLPCDFFERSKKPGESERDLGLRDKGWGLSLMGLRYWGWGFTFLLFMIETILSRWYFRFFPPDQMVFAPWDKT